MESDSTLVVRDHMVSQEDFSIVACSSCGFMRTTPRPPGETIGRYYDSPAYKSHNEAGRGLFDILYHFLRGYAARKKVQFFHRLVPSKSKIRVLLDVGCGIGVFLEGPKSKNGPFLG